MLPFKPRVEKLDRDSSSTNESGSGSGTPKGHKKMVLPFTRGNRRDTDDISRASETPRSLPRASPESAAQQHSVAGQKAGEGGVGEPGDSRHSKWSEAAESSKSVPLAIPGARDASGEGALGQPSKRESEDDTDWDFPEPSKAQGKLEAFKENEESTASFGRASVGSWTFPSYMQRPGRHLNPHEQQELDSRRSSYEANCTSLGLNSRSASMIRSPFADAGTEVDATRPASERDMFASFHPRANFVTEDDLQRQLDQQSLPERMPPSSFQPMPRTLAPIMSMSHREHSSEIEPANDPRPRTMHESSEELAPANDPRPRAQHDPRSASPSLHSEASEHVFHVDD